MLMVIVVGPFHIRNLIVNRYWPPKIEEFGPSDLAVDTSNQKHLSAREVEADVAQRPELGMQMIRKKRKDFADAIGGTLVEAVQFGNVLDENQG